MLNRIEAPQRYKLANAYSIRRAELVDVPEVTHVIHRAFDVWKEIGLSLSPMYRTESQTERHLLPNGFVIESPDKQIVATFSLNTAFVNQVGEKLISFHEAGDEVVEFAGDLNARNSSGSYLVFKKAAVLSEHGQQKLGQQMMAFCDQLANGFAGLALETVAEATWLYQWYEKLGFVTVGSHRYPKSQLETLLMLKPIASVSAKDGAKS